ncbi:MAG: hypothetical protein EOO47_20445 [Flavobacterium sp.]|nr:MAG: hypothetical protein EOO47_20445 [Flavobacterium sp.]
MRTLRYLFIVCFVGIFASCGYFRTQEEPLDESKLVCFLAIDGKDTAWLSIDTSHKLINGYFKMSYAGTKKMDGQIKGSIKGDTLKANYDFKVNNVDKWYRNPVAFLEQDGKLTMGVGEINLVWGTPHFNEKVPIDYEKGRFVFERITCP